MAPPKMKKVPRVSSSLTANEGIRVVEDVFEVQVPLEPDEEDEQAQHEHDVADPGDQEGLLGRRGRRGLGIPEADEQVGAQPHQLPEDEHLEVVRCQDQAEHHADEQGYIGVVAALLLALLVHVADGVDDHQGERRTTPR